MSRTHARAVVATVVAVLMLVASSTVVAQRHFDMPEQAANRLVLALAGADEAALAELLGDDYAAVLPVADIDAAMVDRFLEAWAAFHTLVPVDARTRMLAVGQNGWSLPIPIVREVDGWGFDALAGQEMMRVRRIGRNELSAMQAALAYHDAQFEYASKDRDGDGRLEYAQRFISSPGTRDGLFWEAGEGEPASPLGPLLAGRERGEGYHGYHYRILTAQGEHAPGGAHRYLQGSDMVDGFGLIAWPMDYGETGVMSFLVARNGVLYEADLGESGASYASATPAYDPDGRWSPVPGAFTDITAAP